MKFLSLLRAELQKTRRSGILWILLAAAVILWIPSILNAEMNFGMQAEGISPEHNFLIQGFMAMAWFMFPASMVVVTVLISQTERIHHGMLKMLALPVSTAKLCLAKFLVLVFYSGMGFLFSVGMYYVSAAIASRTQGYEFVLPPLFVMPEAAAVWASSVPMQAFFWMLAVCIRTPVFSIGTGLASIVPSVLMLNTSVWYLYPMAYPFFVITARYGELAENLSMETIEFFPWLSAAVLITLACLLISCFRFGRAERR